MDALARRGETKDTGLAKLSYFFLFFLIGLIRLSPRRFVQHTTRPLKPWYSSRRSGQAQLGKHVHICSTQRHYLRYQATVNGSEVGLETLCRRLRGILLYYKTTHLGAEPETVK